MQQTGDVKFPMTPPVILRHAISRKRPTVNTQQEDENVFHLDTPGKSSSEAVKDIQPILLLVRASSPPSSPSPFPLPDPEVQVHCTMYISRFNGRALQFTVCKNLGI